MDFGKAPSGVRKGKKKQVKDESDRIKQAEKKKRRLEKALATSAAIISELEKKKQKKKEEQQRLDEEGAAIAEAVTLQVLIGEDSDDTCSQVMMERDEESGSWDSCASNFDLFVGGGGAGTAAIIPHRPYRQHLYRGPNEEFGWIFNAHGGSRCEWNGRGWGVEAPYVDEIGVMAAQAVSALQIADDEDISGLVFNRMVRG